MQFVWPLKWQRMVIVPHVMELASKRIAIISSIVYVAAVMGLD